MIRKKYSERYGNLASLRNIDKDLSNTIIQKYEILLKQEIENLKHNKITLPKHFKDVRSDAEYIYDIIDGWLMEDIVCEAWLQQKILQINPNLEVKLAGTDKDRVIQKYDHRAITTTPDLVILNQDKEIKIELQMARRALANGYDMKVNKVDRAKEDSSYFLRIIVPDNQYFFLAPQKEMQDLRPTPNPLRGGKLVYHIGHNFINQVGGFADMKDKLTSVYINKLAL